MIILKTVSWRWVAGGIIIGMRSDATCATTDIYGDGGGLHKFHGYIFPVKYLLISFASLTASIGR